MKKLICIIIFLSIISSLNVYAQVDLSMVINATKIDELEKFSKAKTIENNSDYQKAKLRAIENGWDTFNLVRLIDNKYPEYEKNYNSVAASLHGTSNYHTGGSAGYNLDGNGFLLRLWESQESTGRFKPLVLHENFNTVTYGDNNSNNTSRHATHVAGTMSGNGSGFARAKGMAPLSNIRAYSSNNHISEMAIEASIGALISNHSYGSSAGWVEVADNVWDWESNNASNVPGDESQLFGTYDITSRSWDQIAYDAPFFSIFKAAGNDRNDNPNPGDQAWVYWANLNSGTYLPYNTNTHAAGDGVFNNNGYETIPTYGVAKNIITVGAMQDGSAISDFSGWGPTDDGRVKPDIVAKGVTIISSDNTNTTAYDTLQGTSMSSPVVAGSALLMQEHYEDLYGVGNFMRSATLKSLLIHSAFDRGRSGPDYQFGWGRLSTSNAINLIDASVDSDEVRFFENSLTENSDDLDSYEFYSDGCFFPKMTLVYTDLEGPVQGSNSTASVLVNDLDMVLTNGYAIFLPYVLDPANPNNDATTGDNDIDNVEQILVTSHDPGLYTLTLSYEGVLLDDDLLNFSDRQDYSLIMSGTGGRCNDVLSVHTLNFNILDGTYCSSTQITSSGIVDGSDEVKYRAGDRVILKPGFKSIMGSDFNARVISTESCPPPVIN